jgi:RHS repeat-associated protein
VIGKTSQRTDRTKTTAATTVFSYPGDGQDVDQPHFVTGTITTSPGVATTTKIYTTDVAGNTITRPGPDGQAQTLEWDKSGDLTKISVGQTQTARMVYAADGARAIRQEAGKTTLYVAGAEISQTGTSTPSAVRYYSLAGLAVAMRTGNNPEQTTTLVPDHQNTASHQVDNATGELRTSLQTPYGDTRGQTPTGWTGDRGFVGGTKNTTGLTRIGARDYDTWLGKFITVDPELNLYDPLSWNAFIYANNSPVTFSDSTGRNWFDDWAKFWNKFLNTSKPARTSPVRGRRGWRPPGTHGTYRDTWNAVGGWIGSTLFTPMFPEDKPQGAGMRKWKNPTHLQEFEKQFADTFGFERDTKEYQEDGPRLALVAGAVTGFLPGGGVFAAIKNATNAAKAANAAKKVADGVGSIGKSAPKAVHGNSLDSPKTTYLYKLYDNDGNYLKTGVSQNPNRRYSGKFMEDKRIDPFESGTRREMLDRERHIVERNPGPLNFEPWAGTVKGDVP